MNKIYFSALIVSFFLFSCTDPNTIGLEVQPASDKIILGNNNLNDFDVRLIGELDSIEYAIPRYIKVISVEYRDEKKIFFAVPALNPFFSSMANTPRL